MTNLYLWQWHGLFFFLFDALHQSWSLMQAPDRWQCRSLKCVIAQTIHHGKSRLFLHHITAFTCYINSLVGYSMYVNVFGDVVPCLETTAVTRFVIFSMLTKESQMCKNVIAHVRSRY